MKTTIQFILSALIIASAGQVFADSKKSFSHDSHAKIADCGNKGASPGVNFKLISKEDCKKQGGRVCKHSDGSNVPLFCTKGNGEVFAGISGTLSTKEQKEIFDPKPLYPSPSELGLDKGGAAQ